MESVAQDPLALVRRQKKPRAPRKKKAKTVEGSSTVECNDNQQDTAVIDDAEPPLRRGSNKTKQAAPKRKRAKNTSRKKASSDEESTLEDDASEASVSSESSDEEPEEQHVREEIDRHEAHEFYTYETVVVGPQLQDLDIIYTPLCAFDFLDFEESFCDEQTYRHRDQLYLRGNRVVGKRANTAMQLAFHFPAISMEFRLDQLWFQQHGSATIPEHMLREFTASDYSNSTANARSTTNSRTTRSNNEAKKHGK
jgi:hypothetical protein